MNRPPPAGDPDDRTRLARLRPQPPGRPPDADRPQESPEIPWYLQRPERSASPAPPQGAAQRPSAAPSGRAAMDFTKFMPWLLVGAGGVGVVIGAMVLIGNVLRLGITGRTFLDVTKVQAGVLQTLSDPASGYGANEVSDVSCNGGRNPSAHKGTTFMCDATVNGASRHVTVFVSDDHGTYEIDGPR